MTNSSRSLRHAVRFTLAASAITAGAPAVYAQQAAPSTSAPPVAVEEVVVTGSRIQQSPNEISISPVTSVTAVDIQQTGLTRTEDLLNNLPQVVAEQSSALSISSFGTATVSLRGLGSQRTMVLINGRRMQPGGGLGPSSVPDVNQIPADLLERADILTGGASAVYGADAVAGVVNFILNTHYEGVRLDANYSYYNHKNDNATYLGYLQAAGDPLPDSTFNGGQTKDLSFIAGSNFADGKGNATFYATYMNVEPVAGYQIDHAACTLNGPSSLPAPNGAASTTCGGSSTSATGRFFELGSAVPGGPATRIVNDTVDAGTGLFRAYHHSDSYNYGALSYFQRAQERWTAGAFLHYDINDSVTAYAETMYARNSSNAQYGPSGAFAFTFFQTSCSNPLLTASELSVLCNPATLTQNQNLYGGTGNQFTIGIGRRDVEGGGRIDEYYSNSIRQVIGLTAKLGDAWTLDAYGQVGISDFGDNEQHFLGQQQVLNALDVVTDPATGLPTCASVLNGSDTNCVPWNIWQKGGVNAQQLNYLFVPSTWTTTSKEYIVDASVTGDLGKYGIKSPAAASGLQLNVGAEYREEKYDFNPDYIYANGFAEGGNGAQSPIHGEFHVAEGFFEARMPLVDEKPGFYNLSLEAGYRYSSYTEGFNTNTYKFGVEWAPIQDVRFRGSFNRAVRAPNIGELYGASVIGAGGTADPCWGCTPAYTPAQCANTGVTAAQYGAITANPAAQINTQAGGNPTLKPETADTYSFGVVYQPPSIQGLIVSLDYFNIKINDTIQSLSSNTVIANCANSGSAALCSLIHRDPLTGSLWFTNADYVEARDQNIGINKTAGIDVKAAYRWDMGSWGRMSANLVGVRTQDFVTQPLPTGGSYDCAGFWGSTCNAPDPKWRHVVNDTWSTPWGGLDLTLRWRYIGGSDVDRASPNPLLAAPYYPWTAHIPAYSYFDLSASIPLTTGINFRLGVNNITDKNPPLVLNGTYSDCPNTTCNDNTWAGTYDALGRYIYAHISAKF
jgi:outer membrane receptor protein involved in Fe transport